MNLLVNHKVFGNPNNPCLYIIHGLFGSLDNWQSLARKWSESMYVVIQDVRNHGKSFHSLDMDFSALAGDVKYLMEYLNLSKIHLMGHSMGGKIAMEFAAQYPNHLHSLMIIDVAPFKYPAHHNDVLNLLKTIDLEKYIDRKEIELDIAKKLTQDSLVQFLMKNVKRDDENTRFVWKFNHEVLIKEYINLIQYIPEKGFQGNTLFVGGADSNYITKETSIHIFDLYPNAEFEFIPDAGHWVHADNPQDFSRVISNYISKINTKINPA